MKSFYEKNTYLLNHEANKTFEEILVMSDDEFRQWCIDLRKVVVYAWDELGIPPRVGFNESEMIEQFQQMESFPVNKFLVKDELTGEKDVLRNTQILGNAVNQFFPTMLKVRINYTEEDKGRSIYDFFAQDELLDRFITYSKRHFKRDSFYAYSLPVKEMDREQYGELPVCDNGFEWIKQFELNMRKSPLPDQWKNIEYDYWLQPVKDKEYTGYNEDIKNRKFLTITKDELRKFQFLYAWYPIKHTEVNMITECDSYYIRVYKKGQKLFPVGLKAWRVSFSQYAANYPPLTAKWVYDNFLPDGPSVVWDPSMGWGGRLLGCLSAKDTKSITYLGNDPNTDHRIVDGNVITGETKYDKIYEFYTKNVNRGGMFGVDHVYTWFWEKGSEVMQHDSNFKTWRGKVDLVFTSPPYFNREAYSEDAEQSYKKFGKYEDWKKGFLYETLKTAYYWLKPGGYIIWNIADLKIGKDYLPLEKDSCAMMESFGMKFVKKYKMSMAQMPGANRLNDDGLATAKNSCKVNGMVFRYEPLYVYRKI